MYSRHTVQYNTFFIYSCVIMHIFFTYSILLNIRLAMVKDAHQRGVNIATSIRYCAKTTK